MKKSIILAPILLLLFILAYPCFCNLDVFQYDDSVVYACPGQIIDKIIDTTPPSSSTVYSSFIQEYFMQLTAHGHNYHGSCGFVALGMWLTFFDTYWNDNVVATNYDHMGKYVCYNNKTVTFNSPGLNDPYLGKDNSLTNPKNINDYINYMINDQSSTNLYAYLMKIARDLGYANGMLGLTEDDILDVLLTYLSTRSLRDSFAFTSYFPDVDPKSTYPGKTYTYSEFMRQNIITYVKLGIPVFAFIEGKKGNTDLAHIVIAYDYDESIDVLYAHFGWGFTDDHENIYSNNYSQIAGYIVGTPKNLQHLHAYKYINKDNAEETICSCQLTSHEHEYSYSSSNARQHIKTCYCEYSSVESHTFNSVGRYLVCSKCNYRKLNNGEIIDIPNPNSTPDILEDMEAIKDQVGKNQYLMSA